jgi:hypothetical protein
VEHLDRHAGLAQAALVVAALVERPHLHVEPLSVEVAREKRDHRLRSAQAQLQNEMEDARALSRWTIVRHGRGGAV